MKKNLDTKFELIRKPVLHNYHGVYLYNGMFSLPLCLNNKSMIFVFGDNVERVGTAGQACIREAENSFGIRTKKAPSTLSTAYFYDRDFDKFAMYIDHDIHNMEELLKHHPIVLSSKGYGNGLADLPNRAPNCYNYLVQKLNRFLQKPVYKYVQTNKSGVLLSED